MALSSQPYKNSITQKILKVKRDLSYITEEKEVAVKATGIEIIGVGKYLPEMVATNEDFTKIVETSDEWITQRTGIKTRHLTNGEPTYYLGAQAAKAALEDAGIVNGELVDEDKLQSIIEIYDKAGYEIYPVCNKTGEGLDRILQVLKGKSTVLSGPSGVGKSSLIKNLIPHSEVEIGELSEKIGRGKNTTRHTELIELDNESTVYDTPGYSSIDLICNDETLLGDLFREFVPYIGECRFTGCSHISEPDCAVKNAVNDGIISSARYNSYKEMYSSIKARRKW